MTTVNVNELEDTREFTAEELVALRLCLGLKQDRSDSAGAADAARPSSPQITQAAPAPGSPKRQDGGQTRE